MIQQIPDTGYHPTIPVALERARREFADNVFIVTPSEEMTYDQADSASRRVAKQLLADGIGKGTHVALDGHLQHELGNRPPRHYPDRSARHAAALNVPGGGTAARARAR